MPRLLLGSVMDDDFCLLAAHWTAERALRFLGGVGCSEVVVRREDASGTWHYLYDRAQVVSLLGRADPTAGLVVALDLLGSTPTAERDAGSDAADAPDRIVVTEGGGVVGCFDVYRSRGVGYGYRHRSDYLQGLLPSEDPPQRAFEAWPALTVPAEVARGVSFDIYAGFADALDLASHAAPRMRVERPTPGIDALVLLVGEGVTLDREHDHLPLRMDAQVRFTGMLDRDVHEGRVKALYFYDGQLIGSTRRSVAAIGRAPRPPAGGTRAVGNGMTLPEADALVDITVIVTYKRDGALEWVLVAPSVLAKPMVILGQRLSETAQFAADLSRDLQTQGNRGAIARNILETTGQDIAALIPERLFALLHEVRAKTGRTPTLLLFTDEVIVPWELAYVQAPLDVSAPPFLAAQVCMARWLEDPNVILPPAVLLKVRRITAVASRYGLASDQRELREALAEQDALRSTWDAVPLEAIKADMTAMVSGARIPGHLVHFAVHGFSDPKLNNQALLLADRTVLPARALTGAYFRGDTPRFSFVFLNACQVGTPGRSLGQAGGFPGILVRRGALGFVAPLWEVHDDEARAFAEAFYAATLGGARSVGEALRERRCTYRDDSTTPLAYVCYGHPALRLRISKDSEENP
jgi:hypothetical protein